MVPAPAVAGVLSGVRLGVLPDRDDLDDPLLPACYVRPMGAAEKSYEEIVDLFARAGGSGAVLAFRPSDEAQARLRDLFARGKDAGLSAEERADLERFSELERLVQLVKARAPRLSGSAHH